MGLFSSLPPFVNTHLFVFLCPACSFFRSKTKRSLWRFYTLLKTYFTQLIPTQWEGSPEMAGDKEHSEDKSSLLSTHLAHCSACTALLSLTQLPKASSACWELRICPGGFSWAHGVGVLTHSDLLHLPGKSCFILQGIFHSIFHLKGLR